MTRLPNTPLQNISRISHGRRPSTRGVVIHVADAPGTSNIENWFKDPRAKGVGAHVAVGVDNVVQFTDLGAVCWHAPGANTNWVGIEHVGTGTQSKARWVARRKQRVLSANRTAWILYHYKCGTPKWGGNVRRHSEFGGGHTNCPGKSFPVTLYMAAVNRAYRNLVKHKGKTWVR
jgi:hypothetical protein